MTEIIEWPRAWWPWVTGNFEIMPKSQRSTAAWSQRQSVYGPHVQYWTATFSFKALQNEEAAEREALIDQLKGGAVLLRIGHPLRALPIYTRQANRAGTTPLPAFVVCASSARYGDTSVLLSGLPASQAAALTFGDLVEFQRDGIADETPSLHRVLRKTPTDAGGLARIEFLPPLRKGLAEGDRVSLEYPTTVMRLADDGQGQVDYSGNTGAQGFALNEGLL